MIAELIDDNNNRKLMDGVGVPGTAVDSGFKKTTAERFSSVVACLDGTTVSSGVIPYAQSLANALHADLKLLTVLEPDHDTEAPFDPVEWSLRRREAKHGLESLVTKHQLDPEHANVTVLEGKPSTAIGNYLSGARRDITVFCRKDERESGHIGSTSRCVLERSTGSVYLIPARKATAASARIQRIMVPLDGSAKAESVLPTISDIAQACNATVVLVHSAPRTTAAETMPDDTETANLKATLGKHNHSAAQQYFDRIGRRLRQSGVDVESRIVSGGDTRRQLIETVISESIDLVVLSSHGVSGYTDVPFGDVANYILSRSPVPTLMLRELSLAGTATVMDTNSEPAGRSPEGAR